jgi:hypothetical protein
MKKFILSILLFAIHFSETTAGISNLQLIPMPAGNAKYDYCTPQSTPITCSFQCAFSGSADVHIFLPSQSCIVTSNSGLVLLSAGFPFDEYHVILNSNTTSFSWDISLANLHCDFFTVSPPPPPVIVKADFGPDHLSYTIPINQPVLNYSPGIINASNIKGTNGTRTYTLTPGRDADYNSFSIEINPETEIYITSIDLEYHTSNGIVTKTLNFTPLVCGTYDTDQPDLLLHFSKTTSTPYDIPAGFSYNGTANYIAITEHFTFIKTEFLNPSTSYIFRTNECQPNAGSCGASGCVNIVSANSNVACYANAVNLDFIAGNLAQTDNLHIDLFSQNDSYYYVLKNPGSQLKQSLRIYQIRLEINTKFLDVLNASDFTIGTYISGVFTPLSASPTISYVTTTDKRTLDICFRDIIGIDPDGAGPLTNVFPNPDGSQFYFDLPNNESIVIKIDNIVLAANQAWMNDCTRDVMAFISSYVDYKNMNEVDLCLDAGRQINPLSLPCSSYATVIQPGPYGGISGAYIGAGGIIDHFNGNVTTASSNTDIVETPSQNGDTVVDFSFTFSQTAGLTPWTLTGPKRGSSNSPYKIDILNPNGELYYIHVEIPKGFEIFQPATGDAVTIYDQSNNVVVTYNGLTHTSGSCNSFDFVINDNVISARIEFQIDMVYCPQIPLNIGCQCATIVSPGTGTVTFGLANVCVQFRSQLKETLSTSVIDLSAPSKVYACGNRSVYFHCSNTCNPGPPVKTDDFFFVRNTFGWSDLNAYVTNPNVPDLNSTSGVILNRIYLKDEIKATSSGKILPSACGSVNFDIHYQQVGAVHDLYTFKNGKIKFNNISFDLNAQSPVGWNTSNFNLNGEDFVRVNVELNTCTLSGGSTVLDLLALGAVDVDFEGYYELNCVNTYQLPAGYYEMQNIRGEFTVCGQNSCDSWGAAMNVLITETDVDRGLSYTIWYSFMRPCDIFYKVSVSSEGGIGGEDDFPGEYRPQVRFPDNYSFDISDNLAISEAYYERLKFGSSLGSFRYFDLHNCVDYCPVIDGGPVDPVPGGTLNFSFNSQTGNILTNGILGYQAQSTTNEIYRVQEKGEVRDFWFLLNRDCILGDPSNPFAVTNLIMPLEFINTRQADAANSAIACDPDFPTDAIVYSYPGNSPDDSDRTEITMSPIGNPYSSTGNQLTFQVDFQSWKGRTGWIYTTTPGVTITNIKIVSSSVSLSSQNNLWYYKCDQPSTNTQRLEITVQYTCELNLSGSGYNESIITFKYGVHCNICELETIDISTNSAALEGCGQFGTMDIEVTPNPSIVNLQVNNTSPVGFCDPAIFSINYSVNSGSLNNVKLDITVPSLTGQFLLLDGNTPISPVNSSTNPLTYNLSSFSSTSGIQNLTFQYFPGCLNYLNQTETFNFQVKGNNLCLDEEASPSESSIVNFTAGANPSVSISGPTTSDCSQNISYNVTLNYDAGFSGTILLSACLPAVYTGIVTSSSPLTMNNNCAEWTLNADPSGNMTIQFSFTTIGSSPVINFSIPITASFVRNCFNTTVCPVQANASVSTILDCGNCAVTASFTQQQVSPLNFSFTDQSTAIPAGYTASYSWNFDDVVNGTSTLQNPTHLFSQPGVHHVCLTVTYTSNDTLNPDICSDCFCRYICVAPDDHITGSVQNILVMQPDAAAGKDAMIGSIGTQATQNFANAQELNALTWTVGGVYAHHRSLLQFDLSGIPSSSAISSALLSLYYNPTTVFGPGHYGSNAAYVARVMNSWNENTVTWNNQPSFSPQNMVSLPSSTSTTQDYTNINVLGLINNMVGAGNSNNGFMVKLQNEVPYKRLIFCTSDFPVLTRRPRLQIMYSQTGTGPFTLCANSSITLTAPFYTNATYQWYNSGVLIPGATASTFTPLISGSYTVRISAGATCSSLSCVIQVTINPVVSITASTVAICPGQSATLTAGGGTNYIWNTGATTSSISVSSGGVYTVTGNNQYNCSNTQSVLMYASTQMSLTAQITPASSTMATDGSIDITLSGGAQPFSFVWSNGKTSEDIYSLATGTYTVTVYDSYGCSFSQTFNVPTDDIEPPDGEFCMHIVQPRTLDYGRELLYDIDEGFIVAGAMHESLSDRDLYVVKFNPLVNPDFAMIYGDDAASLQEFPDEGNSILKKDGDYFVVGSTELSSTDHDIIVSKLDAGGSMLWSMRYGDAGIDNGMKIIEYNQNSDIVLVAGYSNSYGINADDYDMFVLAIDANTGSVYDFRTYGNPGKSEKAFDICSTPGELYVLAGEYSNGENTDVMAVQIDDQFNFVADIIVGEQQNETGYSIVETNGKLYIAGTSNSFGQGDYDVYIVNLDNNPFSFAGGYTFGQQSIDEEAKSIRMYDGSNFLLSGAVHDQTIDGFILVLDEYMNIQWCKKTTYDSADEEFADAIEASNTNIIATGYIQVDVDDNDLFLVKINPQGTACCFSDYAMDINYGGQFVSECLMFNPYVPENYYGMEGSFYQSALLCSNGEPTARFAEQINQTTGYFIHPNPFRFTTTLSAPAEEYFADATMIIRDMTGREIFRKAQITGKSVEINNSGWNEGVYIVQISQGDIILFTGKLVLK